MPSILLVLAQFAALAALVVPWGGTWHPIGWIPLALSALLGTWALLHNRPGNFRVMPEPREGARLVTTGPYAFVRHPMYLAVLLAGAGLVAGWQRVPHLLAFVLLAVILHAKALREERLLAGRFPDYEAYRARTRRILPFLL